MNASPEAGALVKVERVGNIAILWMADDARRNALSTMLVQQMVNALAETRKDGVRAIIIASDQKLFCAGADLRDVLDNGWLASETAHEKCITPLDLFEAIESDHRLIFAAVDGLALGGGVELCLACDMMVAGVNARFQLPELGFGVIPNTAIARLPQITGARVAAELILTGRRIDAEEAARLGLASTLAGEEGPVARALEMAEAICSSKPPAALTAVKRGLARQPDWAETREMLALLDRAEWQEGTSAFLGKRAPDFERFWEDLSGENAV